MTLVLKYANIYSINALSHKPRERYCSFTKPKLMKKNLIYCILRDILFYFNGKILLKVNYKQTIDQMIDDCKFNKVKFFIPQNETLTERESVVNAKLFKFRNYYSGTQAVKKMEKAGYKPATLRELLTLAQMKPNLQRKFWIAAQENYSEEKKYGFLVPMITGDKAGGALIKDEWSDCFLQGNGIYCLGIKIQ